MSTILVVDDDADALDLITSWLSARHYEVITASNGTEAIEIVETQPPDLIILDVMMPGLDGIETVRRIRKIDGVDNIPVLLATAHQIEAGRMEGLVAGATDYLTKPVDFNELEERIDVLLARRDSFVDQSRRLLDEVVQGTLPILPCNLAWLLTVDTQRQLLIGQAAAASRGPEAAHQFLDTVTNADGEIAIPLSDSDHPLVSTVLRSRYEYNIPLSEWRNLADDTIYRACAELDIYYVSLLPLQVVQIPLGVLLVGTLEPLDIDSRRGLQLISAVTNQAAAVVNNSRLMRVISQREEETNRERAFRQMLLDTMGDGMLVYNAYGEIRFVNRRLRILTGYDEQTLHTLNLEELFHPSDRNRIRERMLRHSNRRTSSFETRLLRVDGSTVPVLTLQSGRPVIERPDGDEYVMIFSDLSKQKARDEAMSRQSSHLQALTKASEIISSDFSLDQAIQSLLEELRRVLDVSTVFIFFRNDTSDTIIISSEEGFYQDEIEHGEEEEEGITEFVMRTGEPLLIHDILSDHSLGLSSEDRAALPRSIAAVPIFMEDSIGGVVVATDESPGSFDNEDLDLLRGMARSAVVAIENANLYAKNQQRARELALLMRTSEATSSSFAIEEALENVIQQLYDTLNVEWCLIAAWDEQSSLLTRLAEMASVTWPPESDHSRIRLPEHDLAGAAIEHDQSIVLNTPNHREYIDVPLQSVLILPIQWKGHVVGVAELYNIAQERTFGPDEVELAERFIRDWMTRTQQLGDFEQLEDVERLALLLRKAVNADWVTVSAYEGESLRVSHEAGELVWPFGDGQTHLLDQQSVCWSALRDHIPFAASLKDTSLSDIDRRLLPYLQHGSLLIAPLITRGRATGMVVLMDTDPERVFTMSETSLTQAMANVLGHAIENARLVTELRNRAEQLEQAYNHLREADRLKDEVIQNVSHELRTPLTLITGYTELVMEGDMGEVNDQQKNALKTVLDKGRQLSRIVEGIMTVRLIESENLQRVALMLNEAVDVAIHSVEQEAEHAKITIETDFSEHQREVYANKSRMIQVFENLLSNAIKFSPAGSKVLVQITDLPSAVEARVVDQGIGVAEDEHDKIWWRFYQVDGSTTRQFGGTGLGLAIVKRVIEQHEGRVWVESRVDEGSTFGFLIPIKEPVEEVVEEDELGTVEG